MRNLRDPIKFTSARFAALGAVLFGTTVAGIAISFLRLRHHSFTDHFGADRCDLHFTEPCADAGGEAGIGRDRREFGGLFGAEADAGIGDQAVGGGDDVTRAQRGVEREVDRREADGLLPLQVQSARSALR